MSKLSHLVLFLLATCFNFSTFAGGEINKTTNEQKERFFDSKEPFFISLGSTCYFRNLDHIGYTRASFPFDWLLTLDHNGMVKLLDDDFEHFLDPKCYSTHTNKALVNCYYHIEFRHEHDNDFIGKYKRRIDRFRRLNNYPGKVFFMRCSYAGADCPANYWPSKDLLHISFEHALELKQGLKKRFPNLDFSLVILNFCGDRNTMRIADDIIMFSSHHSADDLDFLSKLLKALLKYAEDPSYFREELLLDNPLEIELTTYSGIFQSDFFIL